MTDSQRGGSPAADNRKRTPPPGASKVERETALHEQSRGKDAERRKQDADTGAPKGVNRSNAGEETS